MIHFTVSQFVNTVLNEWPMSDVTSVNNASVSRIESYQIEGTSN